MVPDHELLHPIGSGSYGEVWLARSALGTLRAVKIVRRQAFEDDSPFEREFRGIQQFEPISRSHDGFVDILQVGRNEEAGFFYYVMELADPVSTPDTGTAATSPLGGRSSRAKAPAPEPEYFPRTLRSDLKRHGRLPVAECVQLGLSLAGALDYLHQRGLVHRDLKPSNIIFVGGRPKLADIGLVARAEEADSLVGTLGFIPPEGSGTPRADLFSLGKVLYEISTGRDRREFPQLPPDLRDWADGDALIEFNEIVLKACEHDPRDRYATADEMRGDLELLQGGRSLRRLRTIERRLQYSTRAGLVLAGLLAIAGALYLTARHQAQTNARLAATNAALASVNAQLAADAVRQLYVAEMNLAYQAWDGGNLGRARAVLDRQRALDPALRGFEWRLLEQLCSRSDAIYRQRGHTGVVWSVAIAPDARRIFSGGADGALRIWDAETGRPLGGWNDPGRTNPVVHAIDISPDGRVVASAGRDNAVTLRDAESLKILLPPMRHSNAVRAVKFAPDGRRLASAGEDQRIRIWNRADGQQVDEFEEDMSLVQLAWSPNGQTLAAVGMDTRVHLWDLAARKRWTVASQRALLKAVAYAPDGKTLAAAGYDGVTELWAPERDRLMGSLEGRAPIDALAFSPDGEWLATAGTDTVIKLWSVRTNRMPRQLLGHTATVRALTFSPDGRWLVSGCEAGTVSRWDIRGGAEAQAALAHNGLINNLAFARNAPDSRFAVSSGQASEFHIWDPATRQEIDHVITSTKAIWSIAWAPGGNVLFSGGIDGALRRWEISGRSNEFSNRQPALVRPVHDYAIDAIAVSRDGRLLATACRSAPIKLWNPATLDPIATLPGDALVFRAVTFSPDGHWLAASGLHADVWVWNVAQRSLAHRLPAHAQEIRALAFSEDSRLLASGDDTRAIRLWDVGTWQLRARMDGHDAPIRSLSFDRDGRTLASGGEDRAVKLWNVSRDRIGNEVATLRGHSSQITSVAFAPDGRLLTTAGGDGIVRLWWAEQIPNPQSPIPNPQ